LVGGGEWQASCTFDGLLLEQSGTDEVLILPTAAAFEHPEKCVETAKEHFAGLGGRAEGLMVLHRTEAEDQANADAVRASRFIYLSGGSAMHLRSVLYGSPLWDALLEAWHAGAVLAGSSAGAMVLCNPMVDPRGGAFTVGLGLLVEMAVIPHHDTSPDKTKRTLTLAPKGLPVVAIEEQTALIREPDGSWRVEGAGQAVVFVDGQEADLAALPH
jgi:cyanophycinase